MRHPPFDGVGDGVKWSRGGTSSALDASAAIATSERSTYRCPMIADPAPPPRIAPGAIAAAWTIVALSWGPAAALVVSAEPTPLAYVVSTGLSLLSFLSWAFATPALFRLCRRHPIGAGNDARSIACLAAAGVLIVPSIVVVVPLLETLLFGTIGRTNGALLASAGLLRRLSISSLFSVPTYVAVVAVGQALVWAERAGGQATLAARSELRALRSELSPHFVMNALGAIAQMGHVSADRAEEAVVALADVLRSSLADQGDFQTLADELGAIDAHLDLYRSLTGGLDYSRSVADGSWTCEVPTRILVPLVENALTHGSLGPEGRQTLALSTAIHANVLRIEIINPVDCEPRRSNGLGSGLEQVRQRLLILHGERAQLTTELVDLHYVAILTLPRE
jgi:two-component system, LytTR family, sensor histidine kinase AlgZ